MENYGWRNTAGHLNLKKLTAKARKEVGEYRRMILSAEPKFININVLPLKDLIEVHRSIEICAMQRCCYNLKRKTGTNE